MSELTKEEKSWVKKLQKVLDSCPSSRIGFYTIGDPDIMLYDKTYDAEIGNEQDNGKDFCTAADDTGADFNACLRFPSAVHSTAG